MAQAAREAELDPDRLSVTDGVFALVEMGDFALLFEAEGATVPLLKQLRKNMAKKVLPPRTLRLNPCEIKQIDRKYQPKKRTLPPPKPFESDEQFLDVVDLLDPLAPLLSTEKRA